MMIKMAEHLYDPILKVARREVATLYKDLTIQQALDSIRSRGLGERIVYFYVVDENGILLGVIPTRRLLLAPLEKRLYEVMISQVISISSDATIFEAYEMFAHHRYLAFPVVDEHGKIVGTVDVSMFMNEAFEGEERERAEEVFEAFGFRVYQVRGASPLRAFRFRFPWLAATIAGGTLCALLAGQYEATLAKTLLLAFFMTLVLGLGESVSMQSMTVTIQALHSNRPSFRWYIRALWREAGTALLLGGACGITVGLIAWLWRGEGWTAISIGGSIGLTIISACIFGLSIPTLLHTLKLDPKIAAGPVTLALADICTILIYLGLATWLL